MLPFAVPYPPEQIGYWGPPTATIDWCEENYVVSHYIAEALNTTTNAVFMALASFYIYQTYANKLEFRFVLTGLGFLLVGIGSWLFHMTLRYQYQLLDELPMIYATCIPFWSVYSEGRSRHQAAWVGVATATGALVLTAVYLWLQDPTFHQAAYGLLNAAIIYKAHLLALAHVPDAMARKDLNRCAVLGIGFFGLGYVLWNMDIHLCSLVRGVRRSWGMPYGFVLEGHGWWHIFTGTGVYFCVIYLEFLRTFLNGTDRYYEFKTVWGLPIVSLVDREGLKRHQAVKGLAEHDESYSESRQ
ncbi:alkaline phytoceramidase [Suhomyces tanzawaensis NRRL Y-17324]|uniref:Alkaline phytoceramidase n=1 Tax=Suhomyces tanzawaensis NRRL Y-17324 TaxID=984487 RepID=A0A1E4SB32_9ASCO|nr:alkaline phytoceramidase [Suhomyces tanzawaensis NRRL Y-17324]ODV76713.1 alkaline phytoceramidase [Suhomyces tanzawaensis NRRL Y-17324]